MTTNLEHRLRSADPLAGPTDEQTAADREWLAEQARATVRSAPRQGRRTLMRSRTVLAAAAAVALVAGVGAVASAKLFGGDTSTPVAAAPPLALTLGPSSPVMGTCIRFSIEDLAKMPVAFSGTVTDTSNQQILLDVDHWYAGGDAQQVSLASPDGAASVTLEGTIDFQVGQRYLLTATDGALNYCGFSGPWSQDMADAFAAAFPTP
jgi:hypothetical protein